MRLILYGGTYADDIKRAAVLDLEGDGYEIRPFAPEFDYKLYEGLDSGKALEAGEHFLSDHRNYLRAFPSRILGPGGAVIGYELRPFYTPSQYGVTDVMRITYFLMEGGEVRMYLRLKDRVEMQEQGQDEDIPRR